jgi:acyl-CoA thioesterase FadM
MAEHFPWVEDVVAPSVGGAGHIDNLQIAQLLYDAWMHYMVEGLGQDQGELFSGVGRPIVREINVRFDAEVFPGEALRCGVRATSRSRRSLALEQVLWRAVDEQTVAAGRTHLVTIDTATGQAVEIPSELWAAVERAEGRSIPAPASPAPASPPPPS